MPRFVSSYGEVAKQLGVSRQAIVNWRKAHPDSPAQLPNGDHDVNKWREFVKLRGLGKRDDELPTNIRDTDDDDDEGGGGLPPLPAGTRNYMTPQGYRRLRTELMDLLDHERPKIVEVVSWAAKNGDRSENGDYLYGKRRLREIDRRIRFLTKRLDIAEVADPSQHHGNDQVFFGATVTYLNKAGEEHTVTIVGIDELDPLRGKISWVSPVARALSALVDVYASIVKPASSLCSGRSSAWWGTTQPRWPPHRASTIASSLRRLPGSSRAEPRRKFMSGRSVDCAVRRCAATRVRLPAWTTSRKSRRSSRRIARSCLA